MTTNDTDMGEPLVADMTWSLGYLRKVGCMSCVGFACGLAPFYVRVLVCFG